jgi:hypothetical protein
VTDPTGPTSSVLDFAKATAEKVAVAAGCTLLGLLGPHVVDLRTVPWLTDLSTAADAALVAFIYCVVAAFGPVKGTPSLTRAMVPAAMYRSAQARLDAANLRLGGGRTLPDFSKPGWIEQLGKERDVEGFIDQLKSDDTQEIPRVTSRPLGRKAPTGAPRVKLTASMVPAAAFVPPPAVDWYSKVPASSWGMDGNDRVGDCTCAEVDHSTKARQVAAGNPEVASTDGEVLAAYSAVTGYDPSKTRPDGSNPTDQGAVMQDVRDYWRKHGITLGGKLDKLTLFASVDHTDLALIRWCVDRFGAVALGINFPDTAMEQFDAGEPWDVVKGAKIEGGHAISMVGYDARYAYVVTWGKVQPMTWAFFAKYVEEAWTDVSTDWVNASSGQDPLGEVAYALGEQFAQVTGQPNPFPAPSPAPAPQPAPGPGPAPAPAVIPADIVAWARRVVGEHWRSKKDRAVAQEILDLAGSK